MRTVVLGPPPPEFVALIARRHELGLDKFDEVWGGEYHVAPMADSSHGKVQMRLARALQPLADAAGLDIVGPFNLGVRDDFRVPDLGLQREDFQGAWVPTAAIVVEIESPGDETWEKLPFYAAHGVEEILIASAERRSLDWLVRVDDAYVPASASRLLGSESASIGERIDWPPVGDQPA